MNIHRIYECLCDDTIDSFCPFCNSGPLVAATGLRYGPEEVDEPLQPYPGALTVCSECGGILMYDMKDGHLIIRQIAEHELKKAKERPQWLLLEFLSRRISEEMDVYG